MDLLALIVAMNLMIHFDHMQTLDMSSNAWHGPAGYESGKIFSETNPILGPRPSRRRVNKYFVAVHAVHTGIALALPKKYGMAWTVGVILVEGHYVKRNMAAGLSVRF